MAFCSFGGPGEDNPCGAIEWAKQESSMVPLLCCNADMSSWLKDNAPINVFPDPGEGGHTHGHLKFSFFSCQKPLLLGATLWSNPPTPGFGQW